MINLQNRTSKLRAAFYILLSLLISIGSHAQKQSSATIKGIVLDSTTKHPLEYASIALKDLATSKTVGGCITNANGSFEINHLNKGQYELEVDFVGYHVSTIENILVASEKKSVDIGTILLSSVGSSLQNIVITGKAPVVENKIDRIVYNVANDTFNAINSDYLQNRVAPCGKISI